MKANQSGSFTDPDLSHAYNDNDPFPFKETDLSQHSTISKIDGRVAAKTSNGKLGSIPPFAEAEGGMYLKGNLVAKTLSAKSASIPPFAEANGGCLSEKLKGKETGQS